ncbi:MAG: peptidoglycan DD-metalloendopeptidase family protein [Bacteroidales bacterium]|jgi:murein DD-endopeptidase MepM/ murein hydrolase activator NlpD|nr:peptidoglycan DD-metalloendopeptidase family protein [Bacteroidales bacterium]
MRKAHRPQPFRRGKPSTGKNGAIALAFVLAMLAGCKTVRRTVDAPHHYRKTEPPATQPAAEKTPFPAQEYYGEAWNTEHVRASPSAVPSGTFVLKVGEGAFAMPVCGKVNSEFGPRGGVMHAGIDLSVALNAPVYCAFDGKVRMAKEYGDYGKVVVVRHENGLETLYAHLNAIDTEVNRQVKAGDRIGAGGRTGRATGVHLHFETRFMGEPFNPRLLIDFENCRIKSPVLALDETSYRQYYRDLQPAAAPRTKETAAPGKTPSAPPRRHIAEKGDTLYGIARRYGTTVDALRKLNLLPETAVLQVGQTLLIP